MEKNSTLETCYWGRNKNNKLFINCPKEERNKEILYLFHKDETIIQTIKKWNDIFFFFYPKESEFLLCIYIHSHASIWPKFTLFSVTPPFIRMNTHTHNETMISNWLQCATIHSPFFPSLLFLNRLSSLVSINRNHSDTNKVSLWDIPDLFLCVNIEI